MTVIEGADRRLYFMASERTNSPEILERFDAALNAQRQQCPPDQSAAPDVSVLGGSLPGAGTDEPAPRFQVSIWPIRPVLGLYGGGAIDPSPTPFTQILPPADRGGEVLGQPEAPPMEDEVLRPAPGLGLEIVCQSSAPEGEDGRVLASDSEDGPPANAGDEQIDEPDDTTEPRDIHPTLRAAERRGDVWSNDEVIDEPDSVFFQEDDERFIYVRSNGDGTNTVVVLDDRHLGIPGLEPPRTITTINRLPDGQLQARLDSGRWINDPASATDPPF
jgi:hypothetical protein